MDSTLDRYHNLDFHATSSSYLQPCSHELSEVENEKVDKG
ncbi:hypothetical protein LINPERPRIM_LOCUS22608, partial [Linum perenne]